MTLFSHAQHFFDCHVGINTLYATRVSKAGSRIVLVVQKVVKAWSVLFSKYLKIWVSNAVMPDMFFYGVCKQCFVIITSADGFTP